MQYTDVEQPILSIQQGIAANSFHPVDIEPKIIGDPDGQSPSFNGWCVLMCVVSLVVLFQSQVLILFAVVLIWCEEVSSLCSCVHAA